ncbi:SnoaL-like polyketide cyclase [Saccharomonospora marina XMU15]|uniref:SnoaL-like polyketide cyclase n=1 Tax=Saccharomonospora marina XMU15 TaxID=882083 RepID=H5X0B1_9PSEU|nr:nuclear transport factor 2 family protein [Saccharomonospora marina]EHR48571.1 SnoaL-like polyketide cyclase [Saccharomonospora marina XMU15]
MYERWLYELWNGDLDELERIARSIVTDDFTGHWPGQPSLVTGPDQLAAVVRQGRELIEALRFEIEVGPLVQGDLVAARWVGRGRYGGEPVEFHGHDLLRLDGDRFGEYWVIAQDPTTTTG